MNFSLFVLASLAGLAQSRWISPEDPQTGKDFQKSYTVKDQMLLNYTSVGWEQHRNDTMNLWLVSWEPGKYAETVDSSLSLSGITPNSTVDSFWYSWATNWTIDIPDDVLKGGDRFFFQLKRAEEEEYDAKSFALNSTGFTVRAKEESSTTTSSVPAPTTSQDSGVAKMMGPNAGALAGSALGVVVGALLF